MFFYNDERGERSAVPYHKQNATRSYLTHYDNLLFLNFIVMNSEDPAERQQARREMAICERKLKYWTHHANYDQAEALRGISELKRKWIK